MMARLEFANRSLPIARRVKAGSSPGRLVAGLTLLFSLWLAYHWLFRPGWLGYLPALLQEGLALAEPAGALTLIGLWVGLAWGMSRPEKPQNKLERLQSLSPAAFEQYVAGLFRQKGYEVSLRGGSGDHGVDLELRAAGGKRAVVQCKRYQNKVGEEIVRQLYGTLLHEQVAHAFLVTTATISQAATTWAQGKPITLIDGPTLIQIAQAFDEQADG